ncbi:hypothetical protein ACNS7O_04705 [Haloferacaceae archaeon DSL9]
MRSVTLTLTDDQYAWVARRANERGETPETYLAELVAADQTRNRATSYESAADDWTSITPELPLGVFDARSESRSKRRSKPGDLPLGVFDASAER